MNLRGLLKDVQSGQVKMGKKEIMDLLREDNILTYHSVWPMVFQLLSVTMCLGCSAIFHTYWIQSEKIYEILARLDYGGITAVITGTSYNMIFYCFSCAPVYTERNIFFFLVTFTAITTFGTMLVPGLNTEKW